MIEQGARIAVIEGDAVVREALSALLESWGCEAVLYSDADSYLRETAGHGVVCALVGASLRGMSGLDLLTELRRRGATTPIFMLAADADVAFAVEAMRRGADDVIEGPFDEEPLMRRIEAVALAAATGGDIFARHGADDGGPRARALLRTLTPRETEVMLRVVAGDANKVIAHRLGISLKTVEMHRARVMRKTGAKSLPHLVRLALAAGLESAAPERTNSESAT